MIENEILLIFPPILAILYSIIFRKPSQGLSLGILSSCFIISAFDTADSLSIIWRETLNIITNSGSMYVIGFTILIGILLEFIHTTESDKNFIHFMSSKLGVDSPLKARFVPFTIGTLIFTDTNLSIVSSGIIGRSLFDKFRIPRQSLAFIVDATCAPVSVLVLLNGWGAFISQLLEANGIAEPMKVTFDTIQYNFYPIIVLLLVLFTVISGKYYGPLARSKFEEHREIPEDTESYDLNRVLILVVPLISVVLTCLFLLYLTGDGDIKQGSGSFSVFYAIVISLLLQLLICLKSKAIDDKNDYLKTILKGAWSMREMALIMFLAFMFGSVIKELGTGEYLSGLTQKHIDLHFIPSTIFLLSSFVGFTTGTSWGTYGLMIPIASAISLSTGIDISILAAAVLGGGVFGDHASPISDTSILSSMISGVKLHDHVYTQLPYAIFAASICSTLYYLVS